PAVDRALDAGAELDDGALLVSRAVGADGRSRAHLGGRSVPVGVLGELGEHVLAVHGQSDQQRLLKPAQQRGALDRYAGPPVTDRRERFRADWARWRDVRATLAELTAAAAERVREAELLRLGLAEVAAAEPVAGESGALAAEIERLANADDLRAAAARAQEALSGDDLDAPNALGLATAAKRELEAVAAHDAVLGTLAQRVAEAGHLLTDVALELSSYGASVDADPRRLAAAQERLAVLTALVRRHAVEDVDGVLAWAEGAQARLADLDGADDRIAALQDEDRRLEASLAALGAELSAARQAAAERFGDAVSAELVDLAMPHARVSALVTSGSLADAGADGLDEVELLLVPHPGAPARPLQKGASGGELSRVMLAVEVVFAGSDPVPVMVFDEVDAGVGGKAAVEVGRRLARLARDHQVVVVTHLPQVAAFADRHLLVVKADDGVVTRSGVVTLDDEGRVGELSRMLAGLDSGLARGHAEELLAAAAEAKR
ncbi:MAG: recN, partial [Frankiales bacterium]|nr:recN [Frankiales bacterium]